VPGLYIIGALAGYPLIKQAMNQGYDVIEYIAGRTLLAVDHDLLREKLKPLPWKEDVDEALRKLQERIPVLAKINALQFRELMLESDLLAPKAGSVIFSRNDYTDTFFCVVYGFANVEVGQEKFFTLSPGQFFGEMSLLSGRRRSATVRAAEECVLLEIPRRTMNRLIQSNESVRKFIDSVFIARAIQSHFAPDASLHELQEVLGNAKLERFRAGETLFKEGDIGDRLHLVRSGSLTVSRLIGGREIILSYVPAGNYVGEMGLLGNTKRMATVKAAVATETVSINSVGFKQLLERNQALKSQVQLKVQERLQDNAKMESTPDGGDVLDFLMKQGLGEATDVLLIDESLCVRCDNCERACADTHDGTSRLNREAGPTYATVHVPTSCRHCENPQCMKECPPDAIHRAPNGEVFIADNCIGCGNCQRNCPYGVIQMASIEPYKKRFWRKLLWGYEQAAVEHKDQQKKAVKCDMCGQLSGGPACVRACPTGAAIRVAPAKFVDLVASLRATGVR
jgi:CRP-like cAMP-binding protein/ferredoxin-like protein FixX